MFISINWNGVLNLIIRTLIIASVLGIIALIIVGITACNYEVIDLTYSYDYAYIQLPNGEVIEGPIDSWRDYEDGEQLQVTINGITYLTNSYNCVLVDNP